MAIIGRGRKTGREEQYLLVPQVAEKVDFR